MTVDQAAAKLSVSKSIIYGLVESGKLACHRIGLKRGTIRISQSDLEAFLHSNCGRAFLTSADNLELKDTVVTIDAAGCQRAIAKLIVDAKGDYVFSLKGNQGKLHDAVATYIEKHMENDFADIKARTHHETLKGHGRVDDITYYQMPVPKDLVNRTLWVGLKTIGVAIRISQSDGVCSSEVRYYISSIGMSVKRFSRFVRGHWAIENTLHWCLDVTFREGESRVRVRNSANNLAWLKRFGLSLLKQRKDKHSIAMRRRVAGWNLYYLAEILGIPSL